MGTPGPKRTPIELRFWTKVNKTENCWRWTARINDKGYGVIGVGGGGNGWARAHRVSWELTYGKIPTNLYVLHRCDIRDCVNPDHLFLGTLKDNSQDMMKKGRGKKQFPRGLNRAI